MAEQHQFLEQPAHRRQGLGRREEDLVAHAPGHDGRVVAVAADHLGQLLLDAGLEGLDMPGVCRVGRGAPSVRKRRRAPERRLRQEQHAAPVGGLGELRVLGVVRAAQEVEASGLHLLHVAVDGGIGDGITPTGLVLVGVGASGSSGAGH